MLSKVVKKKSPGAEYRKRKAEREHEFEECKNSTNLQKYFTSDRAENETSKKVKLQLLYHLRNALSWV
jgi:hypothetical protein